MIGQSDFSGWRQQSGFPCPKHFKEAFTGQTDKIETPTQEGRPGRVCHRLYLINIQGSGHIERTCLLSPRTAHVPIYPRCHRRYRATRFVMRLQRKALDGQMPVGCKKESHHVKKLDPPRGAAFVPYRFMGSPLF
jgi:hypothetical protein